MVSRGKPRSTSASTRWPASVNAVAMMTYSLMEQASPGAWRARAEAARDELVGDAFALRERHVLELRQEFDDDLAKPPELWVVSWLGALVSTGAHVDAEEATAVSSSSSTSSARASSSPRSNWRRRRPVRALTSPPAVAAARTDSRPCWKIWRRSGLVDTVAGSSSWRDVCSKRAVVCS